MPSLDLTSLLTGLFGGAIIVLVRWVLAKIDARRKEPVEQARVELEKKKVADQTRITVDEQNAELAARLRQEWQEYTTERKAESEELRKRLRETEQGRAADRASLDELRSQNAILLKENLAIASLKTRVDELSEGNDRLRAENMRLIERNGGLANEAYNQKIKLHEAEARITTLEQKVDDFRAERARLLVLLEKNNIRVPDDLKKPDTGPLKPRT